MNNHQDQFFNKLYAIKPFKETVSPNSSASKPSEQAEETDKYVPVPPPMFAQGHHQFLNDITPLRKVNSDQPTIHQLQIGESNRKTMTSISSTIDILFSKIQKIKEEFSFALPKMHSDNESVSQWSSEQPELHCHKNISACDNKENEGPEADSLRMIEAKLEAIREKVEKGKPLENHNKNQTMYYQQDYKYLSEINHSARSNLLIEAKSQMQTSKQLHIRDFTLGKCIGSGKFGDVYMSKHNATGFVCAIKKILKSTIAEYGMIEQFSNELRIHYSLQHPNIVKLYSHFEDQYHIFLLLELAPHGSLIGRLNMSQDQTSTTIDQISDAVAYIHRKKIIHRDIKPENIVVTMGVPKLCDFGWAAINDSKMHQTFCGTLDYVSPEMKDEGEYNQSIDLWSIGVLTFELLAGFPPFRQQISNWKMKGSKRTVKWSWQVLYPPIIGDQAKYFIQRLLQVDPIMRAGLVECKSSIFLKNYRKRKDPSAEIKQFYELFQ